MAYDGKIMRRAQQRFDEDRRAREDRFQERRERIFRRQPRLREIENELRATMSRIITDALRRGVDPKPAIEALRNENLGLQEEKRILLTRLGLEETALEARPACPLCEDTGYRGAAVCRCLRGYYAREQQKELSRMLDLGSQSFDTFDLEWYSEYDNPALGISDRENMDRTKRVCRRYAEQFGPNSGSLLLTGAPGLGKTHLSAAIAREVSGEGFSVVYDTAGHVFQQFEQQKFGRESGEADSDVERTLTCDLLILDDLGTEMTTAFVQSALYQIINTRLLERRSTIISTNLSPADLAQRYTPQIVSRVEGEYQLVPFSGRDIRQLKKQRNRP